MSVTFEQTPNPATLKFLLDQKVVDEGFDCSTAQEAERSPLATKIFGFPWTQSVYIGPDFVTVTKQDWVDWEILASPLASLIQDHIDNNEPFAIDFTHNLEESENDSEIVKQIKGVLAREIRPVVALDGGDIVFSKFEDGVLGIHMRGACAGCPSSTATLKDGIETRMKELFPEIREVISV